MTTKLVDAELVDVESIFTDKTKRKKVIDNSFLHSLQRRHFILFQILPLVVILIALPLIRYLPFGQFELFLFVLFWLITGFGVSSGYHRLFTHRSYKTHNAVQIILAIWGSMAGQGGCYLMGSVASPPP